MKRSIRRPRLLGVLAALSIAGAAAACLGLLGLAAALEAQGRSAVAASER